MDGTPTITLNDGIRVPLFAYGTATALYRKDAKDSVKMAYRGANMRHIDTAACYGNEDTVGVALKELGITREEVFITTKCESLCIHAVRGDSEC
jgi:diketogulonate reductase-like aldo/keto reductase